MNPNSPTNPSFAASQSVSAETISRRAYEIWEQEGRPEGRDLQHWLQAEQELSTQSPGGTRAHATVRRGEDARFDEIGAGTITDTRPLPSQRARAGSGGAKRPASSSTSVRGSAAR